MASRRAVNTLVVLGQGYVGLPMALHAAESGMKVYGLEINPLIVDELNHGHSHVGDVPDLALRDGIRHGYEATTDPAVIARADVVLVCVPTPLARDGGPDLSAVITAGEMIGNFARKGSLIVLESTTYPGTTEEVFAPLVNPHGLVVGQEIFVAFSPERIDPGNERYSVRNTPKVVGGLTPACSARASQFYTAFIDRVVVAKGVREAEMSKLLENTFRHVNIALVNEMVRFCDDLDIDLWDAIDCAETKPFGFMAFRPGPGVGGHCIPVDPSYLSHRVRAKLGYSFRMVELAEEINTAAPLYVCTRLTRLLNTRSKALYGSRVLLLGVTYKPDVADQRESPAVPIAERLLEWGAQVEYHDPFIPNWTIDGPYGKTALASVSDPQSAASSADAVLLLQPHTCYDMDLLGEASQILLDTRHAAHPGPNVEYL